ncbi:presenilin-like protein At1g08700 [Nicotiana tomentosiformis]|uniref:presenilin-like protein At1g08700 n=1 Tax=Nicotiana tomentosiformis TaxID=4098 RepID=UPI00051AE50D|nr:presenilin-like protein At1g08700 [Nicotiana tomentosiformis]XP_016481324.1 PREDICTED: presenilin-like protein At1g08700 [Nicotiana tabacum]
MDGGSILETIGTEIIGVMSPVSICMFLVVLIVYSLSSISSSDQQVLRTAANLVYLESPTDTTSTKLEGALLNALVFVLLITLVTFLLVILYYYRFTNFLKYYIRFSAFFVLGSMGGSICLSLIQHFNIPIDSFTFVLLLFNFTIVGVISVFSQGVPILLNQMYMVALGIIVAAWFTKLPEWTTWVVLVALALYDLAAVLAPGGPLKILVELASSRDEELPALVYEARPNVGSRSGNRGPNLGLLLAGFSDGDSIELGVMSSGENVAQNGSENGEIGGVREVEIEGETSPLISDGHVANQEIRESSNESNRGRVMGREREREMEEEEERGRGIKLGLGDFVFYSVLVGRAAMYDLMTVYACYLAIISGLGCTLILLAVCRHALPALPISIALGVIFYFLTRLLMEPFVVGTSTNLLMF